MAATAYRPEIYDVVHGRRQQDIGFYVELARNAQGPVLELGAGTGRTALPMARAGAVVDALDVSAEMRAQLAAKRAAEAAESQRNLNVIAGDMTAFDLPRRYALIVIPFRSFQHNLTAEAQLACLSRCRRHLLDGGQLAFDVFQPSESYMQDFEGDYAGVSRMDPPSPLKDGGFLLLTEWNHYNRVAKTVRAVHRYDLLGPDGAIRESFYQLLHLALVYPDDLSALLKEAGFSRIALRGGFTEKPLTPDDADISIIAS
jgi:SAM-dependent methyltransferase